MKLRIKLLLLFVLTVSFAFAKKEKMYPVSNISPELQKGADAVIRIKSTLVEVISESKVVYNEKFVITILKDSGKDKALFSEYYSKLSSISSISATVYDAEGNKVKVIPSGEIGDFTAISGFSLYDDSRVKRVDPKYTVYPFTVAYSFERKYNSAYYLHGWYAYEDYNTAVEKFEFKLRTPSDYKFHFKEYNLSDRAKVTEADGFKELVWSLQSLPALKQELLSAFSEQWEPCVAIAPDEFEINGFQGQMDTWESYGKFVYTLNEGRDNLPQETLQQVKALLNDGMSNYEKVAAIYQYSQKKNRYVSIQEGIGGLQPFDAETVDRLSYGDCKALSNYVVTLLRNFGFNAYYTLVHAGEDSFTDKEFVCDYFNHIITCVPVENDTIWLECTNSFLPCGYLGDFTDDRNVLLVTEEGGKMVRTPAFSIQDNNRVLNATLDISDDGSAKGAISSSYKGALFGDEYGLLLLDEVDRRKQVIKSVQVPHFDLIDYNITSHKERKPSVVKELNISIPAFASKMGDRLFFPLNSLNKSSVIPPYSRNRKTPMMISRSYSETDSVSYNIPEGFKSEAVPEPVEIQSEFGAYSCKTVVGDGVITYERTLKIWKNQYPKEKYNDFVEFLEKIAKYDDAKAVLIKAS